MASTTATTYVGFLLLTVNSVLAIYRSRGDAAAVLFVLASYLILVHLFYSYDRLVVMAEHNNLAQTWVAMAGFGFLTLNSGLAIYRANGDPASILFVAGSYLTLLLLLLFGYLRAFERVPPGSPERERARRRAVWPLTTLLTAAFSSPRDGAAGVGHHMERHQVAAALMTVAFGAMACDSALAVHDARGDVASAAVVLVVYAAFLALTFRFLRAFGGH